MQGTSIVANSPMQPPLTAVMTYIKYQRNDSWWTKTIVIFAVTINLGITVYLWVRPRSPTTITLQPNIPQPRIWMRSFSSPRRHVCPR